MKKKSVEQISYDWDTIDTLFPVAAESFYDLVRIARIDPASFNFVFRQGDARLVALREKPSFGAYLWLPEHVAWVVCS